MEDESSTPPSASTLEAERKMRKQKRRKPSAAPQAEKKAGEAGGVTTRNRGGALSTGGSKFMSLWRQWQLWLAESPTWRKALATFLLLLLFCLGFWRAATAIVPRATPPPAPPPLLPWWEMGALYRVPPGPFAGDLKGMAQRLEHVVRLQVIALVLGPLHPEIQGGDPKNASLEQLDPQLGTLEDFQELLSAARKRGLQVLLDVTPNPGEGLAWLGEGRDPEFLKGVTRALTVWLERGVAGFFVDGIEELEPSVLAEWRNLTEGPRDDGVDRVLVGGSRLRDPLELQKVLNSSGLALALGRFLEALGPELPPAEIPWRLLSFQVPGTKLAWAVGSPWQHVASVSPPLAPQRLLLLWALPGVPVINYGDELGLKEPPGGGKQPPEMPWELIEKMEDGNNKEAQRRLELCHRLGALWQRERSLAPGDTIALTSPIAALSGPTAPVAALLRRWDQSKWFLLLLNPTVQTLGPLELRDPRLPHSATRRLSTHQDLPDPHVALGALWLLPYEGLLLSFPPDP